MRKTLSVLVAAAIAVTSFSAPVAVQAAPLKSLATANQSAVQDVQYYYGGGRRYHGRHHYGHRRHYYRHRRHNGGAVAAAGIVGLAAGVIAGQALAQPRHAPAPAPVYGGGDHHAYCYSKYRSYDARTGTYLGYDGYRHYCR